MADDFAKVFETSHGQLLVTMDAIDDDDQFPLTVRGAEHRGVVPQIGSAFGTPEECRAAFDTFDQARADEQAKGLAGLVDNFLNQEN